MMGWDMGERRWSLSPFPPPPAPSKSFFPWGGRGAFTHFALANNTEIRGGKISSVLSDPVQTST